LYEERASVVTFATAGLLIASILVFSLVALPELMPTVYPQLRHGTVGILSMSTSGKLVGPEISDMEVTVNSISIHRVGVGEGAWITALDTPTIVDPMGITETPVALVEAKVPIGDYSLVKLAFGEATKTVRGHNVTLKTPAQELKVSTFFTIREGGRSNLIIDLSFDEGALMVAQRFDPYVTVTVEQPGHAPLSTIASLKPLASFGPDTLGPGESKSSTFTVESGSVAQQYLVHVEGGSGVENTFNLEIVETGEFWYDLTGSLWFLGGNLTSGIYTMQVSTSDLATAQMPFTVHLYLVPQIPQDLPDVTFSGLVYSGSSASVELNEFALYLDKPGLYDFYLGVKSGDYEFFVDNNPASVTSKDRVVTFQLDSGLHTFQIFTDFSGSGRDTSWSVGVVPIGGGPAQPLSREAMLATGLLLVAIIIFVADVSYRRLRRKPTEPLVGEKNANHDTTPRPFDLQREPIT
jgi:hypothetical protein